VKSLLLISFKPKPNNSAFEAVYDEKQNEKQTIPASRAFRLVQDGDRKANKRVCSYLSLVSYTDLCARKHNTLSAQLYDCVSYHVWHCQ